MNWLEKGVTILMQEVCTDPLALQVLDDCLWMNVAMLDEAGDPYGIPLHVAREGNWLYFHCGKGGGKISCLRANPRVCVTAACDVQVIQPQFTTEFSSVIVRGTAHEVTEDKEKIYALRMICQRFTPEAMDRFEQVLNTWLSRTAIWKIHMNRVTSKQLCKNSQADN